MNGLFNKLRNYLTNTKADWNYILPTALNKLMQRSEFSKKYLLVDIRRPEDFALGHIPGAINIFWLDMLTTTSLLSLSRTRTNILYCYVGHTSSQVLVLLKLLGFKVVSLKFGLGMSPTKGVPVAGWVNYKFPMVWTTPPKSTTTEAESLDDKALEKVVIEHFSEPLAKIDDADIHALAKRIGASKDELEGAVYKLLHDFYGAGKFNGSGAKLDKDELRQGIKVEMEHTKNPRIAGRIAADHLAESSDWKNKKYYTMLKIWEQLMKQGVTEDELKSLLRIDNENR